MRKTALFLLFLALFTLINFVMAVFAFIAGDVALRF